MVLIGFIMKSIIFFIVVTMGAFICLGIMSVAKQVCGKLGEQWSKAIFDKIEAWIYGERDNYRG